VGLTPRAAAARQCTDDMATPLIAELLNEAGVVAARLEVPLDPEEGLVIGRATVESNLHTSVQRLSRKQVCILSGPGADTCTVTAVGANPCHLLTLDSGVQEQLSKGRSVQCKVGATLYLLKEPLTNQLIYPVRIVAAGAAPPAAASASREEVARSSSTGSASASKPARIPPAAAVVVLDSDSDEEPASSSLQAEAATAPPPPAAAAAERPRSRSPTHGVWMVRRCGRFVPYPDSIQQVLEQAWHDGATRAEVVVPTEDVAGAAAAAAARAGDGGGELSGGFIIDFDALRQEQKADPTKWRPVRRSQPADDATLAGGVAVGIKQASSLDTDRKRGRPSSSAGEELADGAAPAKASRAGGAAAGTAGAAEAAEIAARAAEAAGGRPPDPPAHPHADTPGGQAALDPASVPAAASAAAQLALVRQRQAQAFRDSAAARAREEEETAAATAARLARMPPIGKLDVLSYNVWFERHEQARRMQSIARLADDAGGGVRPSLLAMQELTPSLLGLLSPHLKAHGYRDAQVQPWGSAASNGAEKYGVAISTRPPLSPLLWSRFHAYRGSRMGRGLLLGTVRCDGEGGGGEGGGAEGGGAEGGGAMVIIGTTHLESYVGDSEEHVTVPERRRQLAEACAVLRQELLTRGATAAVLMGDLNWTDAKDGDAVAIAGAGWRDAFIEAGKPRGTASTCYSWRFDRCLFLSADENGGAAPVAAGVVGGAGGDALLRVCGLHLAGKEQGPLLDGITYETAGGKQRKLYPSDHRGLAVSFDGAGGAG
jgi:endonuclease/exonuclease/phosphatase family metal-dependent hydrolase